MQHQFWRIETKDGLRVLFYSLHKDPTCKHRAIFENAERLVMWIFASTK